MGRTTAESRSANNAVRSSVYSSIYMTLINLSCHMRAAFLPLCLCVVTVGKCVACTRETHYRYAASHFLTSQLQTHQTSATSAWLPSLMRVSYMHLNTVCHPQKNYVNIAPPQKNHFTEHVLCQRKNAQWAHLVVEKRHLLCLSSIYVIYEHFIFQFMFPAGPASPRHLWLARQMFCIDCLTHTPMTMLSLFQRIIATVQD